MIPIVWTNKIVWTNFSPTSVKFFALISVQILFPPQTTTHMTYRITVILIPQGGHLSPLLFLLYINIIKQLLKYSNILAFADDLKIFLHINSIEDCIRLQTDLNNIFSGCNSLGLKMNIYKCQSMIFTRCCSPNHYRYNINHFELSLVTDHIRDIFILWC